jgi:hypothetical protein
MKGTVCFTALFVALVLAACTSEPETIEVTRVVTEVSEVEVEVTREVDEPEDERVSDGVWCSLGFPRDDLSDFMKVDGPMKYMTQSYSGEWTGVFTGTSEEYWMQIIRRYNERVMSIGTILFDTVEIDGASGSLELYSIGEKPDRAVNDGKGTWVIIEGTGELENLQGHGTYWGQGWQGNYSDCGDIDYSVEELGFKSD